ncbi:hypothetical protein [Mangrovibrevibacter kandeliae]|uniref:hypothetical protein n=1 Tax=Mangrovibrevibacter kandeliae TaxID=2968473 RepID=UPI002117B0F7|nr:hypothetical protein [Aurantimonas sp. CSK15Z-1]MCQ8781626.1 hypothetical protein [Aurantimonas sp. CSK15Z-1]
MPTATADELDIVTEASLERELSRAFNQEPTRNRVRSVGTAVPAGLDRPARRHGAAFNTVSEDIDRRLRDWKSMLRVMEQQRPQLETAENERDKLYSALARVLPEVQESGRVVKALIDGIKNGEAATDLATQFTKNQRALDQLESIAEALSANLLWVRSAWEQYSRSVGQAQAMRDDIKSTF